MHRISCTSFERVRRRTLLGFVTLTVAPMGVVLRDVSLHRFPNGTIFVALPGRPAHIRGRQHTSTKFNAAPVLFLDRAERDVFASAVLDAVRDFDPHAFDDMAVAS